MQVTLDKHHSSSGNNCYHIRSMTETVKQILRRGTSAAAILCESSLRGKQVSQNSTKDVLGVLATLGRFEDMALSRILSDYLGLDMMLALVCKTHDSVQALIKSYDEQGSINKRTELNGLGSSIGQVLDGDHFDVLCLEYVTPYVGDFMPDDPQRRLDLPKPKLPNGESPAGFLGFAVNMIHIDSENLWFVTNDGYGLRETLFYALFSRLQVYETKIDMLNAIPCIFEGAISLEGGMIRSPGVFTIGDRKHIDVNFPICCEACFPSQDYIEIERQMKELKWKKDKMLDDIRREEHMLARAKLNFEAKKEEFVRFMAKCLHNAMQHPAI